MAGYGIPIDKCLEVVLPNHLVLTHNPDGWNEWIIDPTTSSESPDGGTVHRMCQYDLNRRN